LYIDDGVSITPASYTFVKLTFSNGTLDIKGDFGYPPGVNVSLVRFLGVSSQPAQVHVIGANIHGTSYSYNSSTQVLDVAMEVPFEQELSIQYGSY